MSQIVKFLYRPIPGRERLPGLPTARLDDTPSHNNDRAVVTSSLRWQNGFPNPLQFVGPTQIVQLDRKASDHNVVIREEVHKFVDPLNVDNELTQVCQDHSLVEVWDDLRMPNVVSRMPVEVECAIEQLFEVLSEMQLVRFWIC